MYIAKQLEDYKHMLLDMIPWFVFVCSQLPLSIVLVGVGSKPWNDDLVQVYDKRG